MNCSVGYICITTTMSTLHLFDKRLRDELLAIKGLARKQRMS